MAAPTIQIALRRIRNQSSMCRDHEGQRNPEEDAEFRAERDRVGGAKHEIREHSGAKAAHNESLATIDSRSAGARQEAGHAEPDCKIRDQSGEAQIESRL